MGEDRRRDRSEGPAGGSQDAPGAQDAAPATVEDLAAHLAGRSDRELVALLTRRPDLICPPAPSLGALAARAAGPASTGRALDGLDAAALAVASGLVLADRAGGPDPVPALAARLGLPTDVVGARLEQLTRLALVLGARPAPGLAEALAPELTAWPPPPVSLRGPDPSELSTVPAAAVAAESVQRAEEVVRLVTALARLWQREPAPILRTGGVGVRALARTAAALDLAPAQAATVIELAAAAGLLGLDDDGAAWTPAAPALAWLDLRTAPPLPERWAALASPWAASDRTPWLVGARGPERTARAVLADGLQAPWARSLRRRVLTQLARVPDGAVATADFVAGALRAARPRRCPPQGAVEAVLAELEMLGLTGGGALSATGRVLAEHLPEAEAGGPPPQDPADPALLSRLEDALAADLPDPVELLLIQSDLTAVVPGRPCPELADLLERAADVESRGGALSVRLTPDSVRAALDGGLGARELTRALERFSPSGLPATLRALIDDAERHHGSVRVRPVGCVLRVDDEATAAGLLADGRLRRLGLSRLAPGVLAADEPPDRVMRELREAGLAPALEDGDGRVVLAPPRRGAAPDPQRPGAAPVVARRPGARELSAAVARMRAGERQRRAAGVGVATDPAHALSVLRQAQVDRSAVRLSLAGPQGEVQQRRVRVLSLDAGRVRLADLRRQTELTVAVHRVVSVEPA